MRGLYDAETGLTAKGRDFLSWQPDWLDAEFSARLESSLTTEAPAIQIRRMFESIPLRDRARITRAIDAYDQSKIDQAAPTLVKPRAPSERILTPDTV
jgi:hypothetical protein